MKTDDTVLASSTIPAWKPALVWAVLSAVAAAALTPYLTALLPPSPIPLPPLAVQIAAMMLQIGVLAFLFAWAGTAAGRKLGVGSPLLEAALSGRRPQFSKSLAFASVWGVLAGVAIVVLDRLFAPMMPPPIGGITPSPSPLHGLLASLYGGIAEEVLIRLGLMTIIAWAVWRVLPQKRTFALAVGLVLAALLFGALHLPATALIWPITATVVARGLVLNGIFGIIGGVFYVRRGVEHAMVAHLCADLVVHVLAPLLFAPAGA